MRRKRNRRALLLTAFIAMIVAAGAYAYTNTIGGVSPPNLGSGSGAIGGYTASNIVYTLAANPTNLNQVAFNLANSTASSSVQISLDGGTTWYACTMGTPPAVTCATTSPQATAAGATNLTIVAQK